MASILTELGIDCRDPQALAGFWRQVLDYEILSDEPDLVSITERTEHSAEVDLRPRGLVLTFARVPEAKIVKNRMHMDLRPARAVQQTEVRRLLSLGARRVDVGQIACSWVVLADPEGNEFCVLAAGDEPA